MADVERQPLPETPNQQSGDDGRDDKLKVDDVFCDVDVDGTEKASEQPAPRVTSVTGLERNTSSSSCDMAPPPHTRRRTTSTGLISGLINSLEDESREKGREYYEEEMEWLAKPEHPQQKKKSHHDKKHSHSVAEKISNIFSAVEDSSKQKGLEYFEEENAWPLH